MSAHLSTIIELLPPTLVKSWYIHSKKPSSREPYLYKGTAYQQHCVRAHTVAVAQLTSCILTGPSLIAFYGAGTLARPDNVPGKDHSVSYTLPLRFCLQGTFRQISNSKETLI